MKPVKVITILAAAAAILSSCSKNETPDDGRVPVRFSAAPSAALDTRASGETWASGDLIGVRMLDAADATVDGNSNKQYKANTGGNTVSFTAADGSDMYYPMDGSSVGFAAYYPYSSTLGGNNYAVNVADQSDLSKIDLLWVKTATAYHKTAPNVALQFEHRLSKFVIEAEAASNVNVASLAGMAVKISGLNTTASFDILSGGLSGAGSPAVLTPYTVTDGEIYEAVVLPAVIAAGTVTVEFTINPGAANAETFTWNMEASEFETGKEHPWKVTLTRTGVDAIQGTIKNWETGAGGSGIAD